MYASRTRRSPAGKPSLPVGSLGLNIHQLLWPFAAGSPAKRPSGSHVDALSSRWMRWFRPAATWFGVWPVLTAIHDHGCALPQRALVPSVEQSGVPVLGRYVGRQPRASSVLRFV